MYILKNWYFEKHKDTYRIWGNAYGNDRFPEGQWIHTSAIRALHAERGTLIVETENSSYSAKFNLHQSIDQRILRQALRDFLWPDDGDVYEKIVSAQKRREAKIEDEDVPVPEDFSTCAVLTFSADILNGFVCLDLKRRKKVYHTITYQLHKGMFQDYIEISDYELDYNFRFFCFTKNAFQFDPWNEKYSPVFMKNIGKETIYVSTVYGDFEVPTGETVLLSTDNRKERVYDAKNDQQFEQTTIISHESMKLQRQ